MCRMCRRKRERVEDNPLLFLTVDLIKHWSVCIPPHSHTPFKHIAPTNSTRMIYLIVSISTRTYIDVYRSVVLKIGSVKVY